MDGALTNAKNAFETATSVAALQAALGRFLEVQGVEQYAYFTDDAGPRRLNPVLISNYAPDWLDHYMASAYARDDPVFREADGALAPFAWSSETPDECWGRKARAILDEARSADIAHGVSIPFQIHDGRAGAMTFASALPRQEFLRLCAASRDALLVVASYFHAHAARLTTQRIRATVSLTEREVEILYACACGYDAEQIAERLDISVATVRVHFRNINQKYGVRSIRNACLAAMANLDIDMPAQALMGVRTHLT